MSMTTGDELGKSDVFVNLAEILFSLAEGAVLQGTTMKDFECGLFGGLAGGKRAQVSLIWFRTGIRFGNTQ